MTQKNWCSTSSKDWKPLKRIFRFKRLLFSRKEDLESHRPDSSRVRTKSYRKWLILNVKILVIK